MPFLTRRISAEWHGAMCLPAQAGIPAALGLLQCSSGAGSHQAPWTPLTFCIPACAGM